MKFRFVIIYFSDTICDLGGASELANYGEYSGAPSEQQTYDYARTILDLMTKKKREDGKVLIIGGGIANFTNVAATFKVFCLFNYAFWAKSDSGFILWLLVRSYPFK